MKLETKRIKLRKLKISDAEFISQCSRNREITRYTLIAPPPYGIKEARQFIRGIQKKIKRKKALEWGIELKENKELKLIGMVLLNDLDFKNKNANIGVWLVKKYWGKGLANESLKLILDFGFKELNLERIQAKILHENIRSQKLLKKIGFKYEGRLRKKTFFKNKWYDDLIYGLLREEYFSSN